MQVHSSPRDLNLVTLALKGDALLADVNQLRDQDPIYWSDTSQCWIVSGHKEVMEGFSGTLPLLNHAFPEMLYRVLPKGELEARLPNSAKYMTLISTNLDGAEHATLRKLLVKAVNRKLIEDLRPYVRERVSTVLDIAAAKGDVEFHEEVSRMLPGAVILRLLGMSTDYLPRLKTWADGVTRALTSFDPQVEWLDGVEVVVTDMLDMFHGQIEDRRKNPRTDLITQLVNVVEDNSRLSMDDILGTLIQVIVAGHDTTTNSMTLGARALAKDPAAWRFWREHPEKGVDCAIELMRYIAMSTILWRTVAEDFQWGGKKIRRGQVVTLMIAGGNRDPKVYTNPEAIDFTRTNDSALTFGPGLHHCIGHLLAKLQVSEFFTALTGRFDGIELLEEPTPTPALVFRSVNALQVRMLG